MMIYKKFDCVKQTERKRKGTEKERDMGRKRDRQGDLRQKDKDDDIEEI